MKLGCSECLCIAIESHRPQLLRALLTRTNLVYRDMFWAPTPRECASNAWDSQHSVKNSSAASHRRRQRPLVRRAQRLRPHADRRGHLHPIRTNLAFSNLNSGVAATDGAMGQQRRVRRRANAPAVRTIRLRGSSILSSDRPHVVQMPFLQTHRPTQ